MSAATDRVEVAAMVTFCAKLSAACELVRRFEDMDVEQSDVEVVAA